MAYITYQRQRRLIFNYHFYGMLLAVSKQPKQCVADYVPHPREHDSRLALCCLSARDLSRDRPKKWTSVVSVGIPGRLISTAKTTRKTTATAKKTDNKKKYTWCISVRHVTREGGTRAQEIPIGPNVDTVSFLLSL